MKAIIRFVRDRTLMPPVRSGWVCAWLGGWIDGDVLVIVSESMLPLQCFRLGRFHYY